MSKPVDKIEFWKERISSAKEQNRLHYSVYLASDGHWNKILQSHLEVIGQHIKDTDRVLDVGCGYGRMSEYFENYVGIDFSPDFIAEANRLFPNKKFLVGDIKDMPFKDKEFDWGFLISIKQMVIGNLGQEEWEKMEKEIRRVCKRVLILEYGTLEDHTDTKQTISLHEIL